MGHAGRCARLAVTVHDNRRLSGGSFCFPAALLFATFVRLNASSAMVAPSGDLPQAMHRSMQLQSAPLEFCTHPSPPPPNSPTHYLPPHCADACGLAARCWRIGVMGHAELNACGLPGTVKGTGVGVRLCRKTCERC
jgi:hypothetical protein